MFDKRNDSIASFAKIDFFEGKQSLPVSVKLWLGTLNILCVAENVAGSSHEEICLTTDVSGDVVQRDFSDGEMHVLNNLADKGQIDLALVQANY